MIRAGLCAVALALGAVACGGGGRAPLTSVDAVERTRISPAVKEAERVAPQVVALADIERKEAARAASDGDEVAADLHAERALVHLQQAIVLTRIARAAESDREARARGEKSAAEARELAGQRAKLDAANDEMEKRVKVARDLAHPPVSGPADPKREAARRVAAESLMAQAKLLCGAGRLVATGTTNAELDEAEKAFSAKPAATGGAAIDAAARARAACLGILTKLRRGGDDSSRAVHADALLADLTAASKYDAARDERGVVVTVRDAFDGAKLKPEAEKTLGDLGRVLKANGAYRAQVVVHESAKRDDGKDRAKAAAAVISQVSGVAANAIESEDVGTLLPVVDPQDAKMKARNARLEVVFVSPTN